MNSDNDSLEQTSSLPFPVLREVVIECIPAHLVHAPTKEELAEMDSRWEARIAARPQWLKDALAIHDSGITQGTATGVSRNEA